MLLSVVAVWGQEGGGRAVMTAAQEVRDLSPEEADRGHRVRLQGIVLYFSNNPSSEMMICDETAALYISGHALRAAKFSPGDRVAIEGTTSGGDFAPMVVASKLSWIGHGELPLPREMNFSELTTGAEDGQWVKVSGIIRAAALETADGAGRLTIALAVGDGRLTVRVPNVAPLDCAALVDAEATVTGICIPVFNGRRQLLGVRLRAPELSFVELRHPANLATFESQPQRINSLLKFRPGGSHRHRVKVHGVVTLQRPGECLVIRDDTQALWVKTVQPGSVQPGDNVDVLGFPAFGDYNPVLEDATFLVRGPGAHPPPGTALTADRVTGDRDAELVQIDATVLHSAVAGPECIIVLQDGDRFFRAHLPLRQDAAAEPTWSPQTRLRLTGICRVEPSAAEPATSFELLLRSAADVEVLRTPSWWNLRRAAFTLGITSVVSFGALGWVVALRRQVRRQTSEIQRKLKREAVLQERSRIAREFHDTLEQELGGALLQLQAARQRIVSSPQVAADVLGTAESMLRHTQSEARSSIWDLRALALENGTLESALRTVAQYACNGAEVAISVTVEGAPRPLSSRVENHLLRIAQEATTNAIKHGAPRHVRITLHYEKEQVRLRIDDDGRGFEPSDQVARPGHFGLMGMRERAEEIGGRIFIRSSGAAGAQIEVTVGSSRTLPELA